MCVCMKTQHILSLSLVFNKRSENKKLRFAAGGLEVEVTFLILHKCHMTEVLSHNNMNLAVLFCIRPTDFDLLFGSLFALGEILCNFLKTYIKMKCYVLQFKRLKHTIEIHT